MKRPFSKALLPAVAGVALLVSGCEQAPKPAPPTVTLPDLPPPATGFEVAILNVTPPDGSAGHQLFAGVTRDGHLVARGEATINGTNVVEVAVRAVDPSIQFKNGPYEVWLVIKNDGWQAWHPAFGEVCLHDTWEWPQVSRYPTYAASKRWQPRPISSPDNLITIHYHRHDEDYDDAGLWSWDENHEKTPETNELLPVDHDDFGLVFQLDRGEYGAQGNSNKIGLVPRLHADWSQKDGDDKFWRPDMGKEIYLIGGDAKIYMKKPDVTPQVVTACIDARDRIVVQVSRPLKADEATADSITITDRAGKTVPVTAAQLQLAPRKRKSNAIELTLAKPLDVTGDAYAVSIKGFNGSASAMPRGILDDPDLFCDRGAVLGATYSSGSTTFRLFAPTARAVQVILYDNATGSAGRRAVPLAASGKGIWEANVAGDLAGKFYVYSIDADGLSSEREVLDISCVNAVDSSRRARITDLTRTNPDGWMTAQRGPNLASPVDMVVYEMHVRDFSIAANSGMQHKGKYLAFTETGTHLPDDPAIKTGLDHLVELGVTHVQLLPIQDFENDETGTNYNWGYVTTDFDSPEGWYATNPNDDSRIRELKQLVKALHERGIGVIMDVVYNHTSNNAPFNGIVPRYYFRQTPEGGYANGSGCGNDFRTEAPMARKYVVDSLKYWVREYGIDGFRFDLMALLDLETMKEVETELRALNPRIVLYGEPWAGGGPSTAKIPTDKQTITGTHIGAFNDNFRNVLVGSPFDKTHGGFIQQGDNKNELARSIQGQWRDWSDGPFQVINFLSCHDNYVVYDKLRSSKPDATSQDLIEMMKLGYFMLFTSQGVPFIHGGEEFARTKQGNENSYNAPDNINEIDWSLKKQNLDLFHYVRDLIALRKAHPAFRIRAKEQIAAWLQFQSVNDPNLMIYTIDAGNVAGEPWKQICVIANAADSLSADVTLPPGVWQVAIDKDGAAKSPQSIEGTAHVRYKSGMVLFQP